MPSSPTNRSRTVAQRDQRVGWHFPASGTETDISTPAYEISWPRLPLTYGVDPRFSGVWRKLPGWRHITTDESNQRIRGNEVGLGTTADVTVEYFKPVVLKYGSEPYERRGFVVSTNNVLLFKYYDTKEGTWTSRILETDLVTHFGTRTDFDVATIGKYLYVSRGFTQGGTDSLTATSAKVYWWDDNRARWKNFGGGTFRGDRMFGHHVSAVIRFTGPGGGLYFVGPFDTVGGATETGAFLNSVTGFAHYDPTTDIWTAIGRFDGGMPTCLTQAEFISGTTLETGVVVGGDFTGVAQAPAGGADLPVVAGTSYMAAYIPRTGLFVTGPASIRNGLVRSVSTDSSGNIIVGGEFTEVQQPPASGGAVVASNRVALYLKATGLWDTAFGSPGIANGSVAVIRHSGSTYWAGGLFSSPVSNLAQSTGGGTWTAGVATGDPDAEVLTMAFQGTKIYIGGKFSGYTGNPNTLPKIAEISTNAYVNPFQRTNMTGNIYALGADSGSTVYLGGDFTALVGGSSYTGIAKFDSGATGTDPTTLSSADLVADPAMSNTVLVKGLMVGDWSGATIASSQMEGVIAVGNFGTAGLDSSAIGVALWTPGSADNFYSAHMPGNNRLFFQPSLAPDEATPEDIHLNWGHSGKFKGNNYSYAFFVRFVDHARGYTSPPSTVVPFKVPDATNLKRFELRVSDFGIAVERPTAIQVWRSIGAAEVGGVIFPPVGGPFYLESEIPLDPDAFSVGSTGSTLTYFYVGKYSDEALVQQPEFDPLYDLTGARKPGPAIGATKNCLVSVAAGDLSGETGTISEAFFDARWSPPWVAGSPPYRRIEGTSFAGSHRSRVVQGDLPRLIEVGDFLLLTSNEGITRFQKQGDYLQVIDGPVGVGVLNWQAQTAIGGDLWFVSNAGEMVRMNVATGGIQTLQQFSRLLRTRWKNYVRDRQMSVAYDPKSQILLVGPVLE